MVVQRSGEVERLVKSKLVYWSKLEYRASVAQWKAELIARRPKTAKLAGDDRLREYVQDRLAGQVRRPDGTECPGLRRARGRAEADAGIADGRLRGARSRSPTG